MDNLDNLDMGGTETCRQSSLQIFYFKFQFEVGQRKLIVDHIPTCHLICVISAEFTYN